MSKKSSVLKFSTDRVARKIWYALLGDFRLVLGDDFASKAESEFETIEQMRNYEFPQLGIVDPWRFKAYGQLRDLFKKYRFASDIYSDDELHKKTLASYFEAQEDFCVTKPVSLRAQRVYAEARRLARTILGVYSEELVNNQVQFGKNSSIGCPFALAYLDHKLTEVETVTGSAQCTKWFISEYLPTDGILSDIFQKMEANAKTITYNEALNLIDVPKTWKINRAITPLNLLDVFFSFGYGKVVQEQLKVVGIDIRRQQNRHRILVKEYSKTLKGATVDLTRASDSLLKEHLNRVLPRDWYVALKKTLTHQINISEDNDTRTCYTASVLPMGNGATFPVETLIFYCIIKAVGNLLGVQGMYSVYGDDLIYPSKIHGYVADVFKDIGFKINADKSFVSTPFRESCGADYYRGCDVRPFVLGGASEKLTRSQYITFLYKVINGLRRRWSDHEINGTLRMLFIELGMLNAEILRVPPNYPDTAGIKTSDPDFIFPGLPLLIWSPVLVYYADGSRWYTFRFYRQTSKRRFIRDVAPYYWSALAGKTDVNGEEQLTDYEEAKDSYATHDTSNFSIVRWAKFKRPNKWKKKNAKTPGFRVIFKPWVGSKTEFTHTIKDNQLRTVSDWNLKRSTTKRTKEFVIRILQGRQGARILKLHRFHSSPSNPVF